jgi:hypothetical protein
VSRWYNPQGRIKPTTLIGIYTNQILRMLGAAGRAKRFLGEAVAPRVTPKNGDREQMKKLI